MSVVFIVRAELSDLARKAEFDRWYETTHLPMAIEVLAPARARRAWSRFDPAVHYVIMEVDDVDRFMGALSSDRMKAVGADFDRSWGDLVTRTRDVAEVTHASGRPA